MGDATPSALGSGNIHSWVPTRQKITNADHILEKTDLNTLLVGTQHRTGIMENRMEFSEKKKKPLMLDVGKSAILHLGKNETKIWGCSRCFQNGTWLQHLGRMWCLHTQNVEFPMFVTILFTITKIWTQSRCLSFDEWIDNDH